MQQGSMYMLGCSRGLAVPRCMFSRTKRAIAARDVTGFYHCHHKHDRPEKILSVGACPPTLQKSGKKRAHKLKNNPWDAGRVSLEHPAGQTGVYRPVSQGFPVIYYRKTDRKGHVCRDTGRVSQGHPAVQGVFRNFMWFFLMCLFCFLSNLCCASGFCMGSGEAVGSISTQMPKRLWSTC